MAPTPSFPFALQTTPSLQSLRLDFAILTDDTGQIEAFLGWKVPWHQLIVIELYEPLDTECVYLLSRCSKLEKLLIQAPLASGDDSSTTVVSMATEVRFESAAAGGDCEACLSVLTLPSLQTLHFGGQNTRSSQFPLSALSQFLSRSQCSITTFSLRWSPLNTEELVAILRLFPTLTNLTVVDESSDSAINNEFVKAFIPDTENPLLPKVEEMEWRISPANDRRESVPLDYVLFLSMLVARSNQDGSVSRIRRATLWFNKSLALPTHKPTVDEVKFLQEKGMVVLIDQGYESGSTCLVVTRSDN